LCRTHPNRINAARYAVGDSGDRQRLIKTLPRKGLRFIGAVREDQAPTAQTPALATHPLAEATPGGHQRTTLALPSRPSIAVLPFDNMSGDPGQEYFADGISEDLISGLARIRWLFVIARNSAFVYKHRAVDVKQISRELGVRYVLQGGVRRAGKRIRIQRAAGRRGDRRSPLDRSATIASSVILDTKRAKHPGAARTLFAGNLRPFFAWCLKRKIVATSPAENIDAPKIVEKRDRVLSEGEVRAFWLATAGLAPPYDAFHRALLLTAQRREEVAGMRWPEVDVEKGIWLIPEERTKNGRTPSPPIAVGCPSGQRRQRVCVRFGQGADQHIRLL
jgi:TolB-like protein